MRVLALAAVLAAALLPSAGARADGNPEKEPGPKSAGRVYAWKSEGGLLYEYFVPRGYDPEKGANLTFICHGTGLDRRWGFLNHRAGGFRPDDIVVSPDGPVPQGRARLFAYTKGSLDALHELQKELSAIFRVRQVFVYGHSQGAFFSILYAATFPEEVDGALAHAGGVLNGIRHGPAMGRQALVMMHGTADPVVPYTNSIGGWDWLVEQKHELRHIRALEGWNHWPHQGQAGQCLAWMEGMTTKDPDRLAASFAFFDDWKEKEFLDFAAFHAVAKRLAGTEDAPESARRKAEAAVRDIEALAERHAEAVRSGGGKDGGAKFDGKPWIGHALRFLRDFRGVPARETLAGDWERTLKKHEEDALGELRDYWRTARDDPRKAFGAGVLAIRKGFLSEYAADPGIRDVLAGWAKDAKKIRLDGAALKLHGQIVPAYAEALEKGLRDYNGLNRKL